LDDLDLTENRVLFEYKMQPSELDKLPFFKFISVVNSIVEMDKKQNEQQTEQEEYMNNSGIGKQMNSMTKNFKFPKSPKF
jgi:hypothetical protein